MEALFGAVPLEGRALPCWVQRQHLLQDALRRRGFRGTRGTVWKWWRDEKGGLCRSGSWSEALGTCV